jgi:hypothetical protein
VVCIHITTGRFADGAVAPRLCWRQPL